MNTFLSTFRQKREKEEEKNRCTDRYIDREKERGTDTQTETIDPDIYHNGYVQYNKKTYAHTSSEDNIDRKKKVFTYLYLRLDEEKSRRNEETQICAVSER